MKEGKQCVTCKWFFKWGLTLNATNKFYCNYCYNEAAIKWLNKKRKKK